MPLTLLAVAALVLAACGEAESTPTQRPGGSVATPTATRPAASPVSSPVASPAATPVATPSGSPVGTPGATPGAGIQHPTGANELILLMERTGGFVPLESLVTSLPAFALYGDGRFVTHGPQTAIFPPHALPNLRVTRITEAGIQAILAEAQSAGLLDGDRRYEYPLIADAPWSEFTTFANGRRIVVAAYALGLEPQTQSGVIPPDQRLAREKLLQFQNKLISIDSWLPPSAIIERDAEYRIDRLQIVSVPVSETATPPTGITPQRADWPLATPLGQLGDPYFRPSPDARCFVLQGQDLTTVLGSMARANTLTRWVSAGQAYNLLPRPVLPHETGCPPPR